MAAFGAALGLDLSGPELVRQQNTSLHPDAVVLKRILHATRTDKDTIRADIEAVLNGPSEPAHPPVQEPLALRRRRRPQRLPGALRGRQRRAPARRSSPRCPSRCSRPDFPDTLRFGDTLHPHFLGMLLQALKPAAAAPPPPATPK